MPDDTASENPNVDDSSIESPKAKNSLAAKTAAEPRRPWRRRWPFVLVALVVIYPVGLWLLIRRKRPAPLKRFAVAVLTVPLFVAFWVFAFKPYIAFDGGVQSFWLDFRKGGRQAAVVAAHRERMKGHAQGLAPEASPFADLWYPGFRGAHRDGVVPGDYIALDWREHPPRERWRIPVGDGWASMSVGYGRLYTIEQRGDDEAVACYDAATGTELWTHTYPARFVERFGGDGPRSTPTLHDGRVIALGAEGHLHCLDARSGSVLWKAHVNRDFGADNLTWAMSASPYVYKGTVIVTNSGIGGGSIIAYRLDGGAVAWTCDEGQQSYSSPVVATVAGRDQLLNLAASGLNGVDPRDGTNLWSFPFNTQLGITASQPIVIDEARVFVSAGYGVGCAMVKLEQDGDSLAPTTLWRNVRMKNKFTSSVYYDGHLYGLDERILACLDAETGERKWKGGRYNYGSLLLVQGHLLVLSEEGELVLVEATPDAYREIGRVQILNDKTWNNHVLVGGILFARNHREMVCYDLRSGAARR